MGTGTTTGTSTGTTTETSIETTTGTTIETTETPTETTTGTTTGTSNGTSTGTTTETTTGTTTETTTGTSIETTTGTITGTTADVCGGEVDAILNSLIRAQEINGGTYRFIHTPKSWDDAQMFCESLGGNLFVPQNEADNDAVASFSPEATAVWIGVTDQKSEGAWVDPNGAALTFTNWYTHAS